MPYPMLHKKCSEIILMVLIRLCSQIQPTLMKQHQTRYFTFLSFFIMVSKCSQCMKVKSGDSRIAMEESLCVLCCYNNQLMKDQNTQNLQILHSSEPKTNNTKQTFQHISHSISHQNRLQVDLKECKKQQPYISNYFAAIQQNLIAKTTEILLEDRVIKIVDIFKSTLLPIYEEVKNEEKQSQYNQDMYPRKSLLEKKPKYTLNQNGQEVPNGRDNKNVVKNIFRLFQTWVSGKEPSNPQLNSALMSLLSRNKRFNNGLIFGISRHPLLSSVFVDFCRSEGQSYIEYSRIRDKRSHVQALRRYCKICNDEVVIWNNEQRMGKREREQAVKHVQSQIEDKSYPVCIETIKYKAL